MIEYENFVKMTLKEKISFLYGCDIILVVCDTMEEIYFKENNNIFIYFTSSDKWCVVNDFYISGNHFIVDYTSKDVLREYSSSVSLTPIKKIDINNIILKE